MATMNQTARECDCLVKINTLNDDIRKMNEQIQAYQEILAREATKRIIGGNPFGVLYKLKNVKRGESFVIFNSARYSPATDLRSECVELSGFQLNADAGVYTIECAYECFHDLNDFNRHIEILSNEDLKKVIDHYHWLFKPMAENLRVLTQWKDSGQIDFCL